MSSYNLANSFLAGQAENTDFTGADLSYVNFLNLRVTNSEFGVARLRGALVPEEILKGEYTKYMKGADWWDTQNVSPGFVDELGVEIVSKNGKFNSISREACPVEETGASVAPNEGNLPEGKWSISLCGLTPIRYNSKIAGEMEKALPRADNEEIYNERWKTTKDTHNDQ